MWDMDWILPVLDIFGYANKLSVSKRKKGNVYFVKNY
jgi:hypothetical protein